MNQEPPTAKGQWKHAPLVFVLAQVRFTSQPEGFTEQLQQLIDQLEPGRFLPAQPIPQINITVEFNEGAEPVNSATPNGTAYTLIRNDGQMTVRIAPDAMTLAVTEYFDWEHMQAQWQPMLQCLPRAALQGDINRAGLRYVDFVIPSQGKQPEYYLTAPWNMQNIRMFPGAKGPPSLYVNVHDFEYPEGRMRVQFMRGHGKPALPSDLQGELRPPFVRDCETSAIIDTDRWVTKLWKPDAPELLQAFDTMHKDLSAAFGTMITEEAKAEWNPSEGEGAK